MIRQQYRIGRLTLQPYRQLRDGNDPVALRHKALDLLSVLTEAKGAVMTKDELIAAVWPDISIEDNGLQVQISILRKALGVDAYLLKTARGIGYFLSCEDISELPDRPSGVCATIAVLPFANLSGEANLDYLCDGIAEELINCLTHQAGLGVASRTSSFAYKGRVGDARQIGHELGVDFVVEGSIRSAGEIVRFTTQLVDVETGLHRWSENYDRKLSDSLRMEDELACAIVEELGHHLEPYSHGQG